MNNLRQADNSKGRDLKVTLGEVKRGKVQYMSAGTGVYHSEYNLGHEPLRLLQIWILPDKDGYKPNYGQNNYNWSERENKWLHLVSKIDGNAPIKIHQDVNLYALYLDKDNIETMNLANGRQAYLVQIEGNSTINEVMLNEKDALEIIEENIKIKVKENSHFLLIEMKKEVQTYV